MSKENTTVVICCAGMGTRLGIGSTKALLHIAGKPLIIWQLEALNDFDDVRVVVGYQAEKVIEVVNSYRRDVMFAFNNEFKNTGAAASLSKGMINAREYVLSIDGDILIKPSDFKKLLNEDCEYLAISNIHSTEPIHIDVKNGMAVHFSKEGNLEWPGVAKIKSDKFKKSNGHTYEALEELLPIKTIMVRSRDIDTPEDYENALEWVNNGYSD